MHDKGFLAFRNTPLVDITTSFVFTAPFLKDDATNRCSDEVKLRLGSVHDDQSVIDAAKRMRTIFLEKKECLSHGDLHTGSIMVSDTTNLAKVFNLVNFNAVYLNIITESAAVYLSYLYRKCTCTCMCIV